MAQKFIVTREGFMRLGDVRMHKNLLLSDDDCIGGGFYRFDYIEGKLLLDGASYDFGTPRWELMKERDIPLKVPQEYRGFLIVYHTGDQEYVVSRELRVEYI